MAKKVARTLFLVLCAIFTCGLDAIAQHQVRHSAKLSSATVERLAQQSTRSSVVSLQAYVTLKPNADVALLASRYGVRFNVQAGDTYTALIPVDVVKLLASDEAVVRIDVGSETRTMTDQTRVLTHSDMVTSGQSLPQPYDGTGVLVGIVDTGFDFLHPAFRDEQGKTRIVCAWDQQAQRGTPSAYGYGCVYQSADIVAAARRDQSMDTHGTHVLGIASGSVCGAYGGIAPKANMVVVSTNKSEQGIVDGVDFLLKYAEQVGKPIAINVSLGTVLGYKDGTGDFAYLLDELLRNRKGALLCIAAGNEGHRRSMIAGNTPQTSCLMVPTYGRDNVFVQCQEGYPYRIQVTLRDTVTGKVVLQQELTSQRQETVSIEEIGGQKASNFYASSQLNARTGAPSFTFNLNYTKKAEEMWTFAVSTDGGRYTMGCDYGAFSASGQPGFVEGCSEGTVAATATGHLPISVAAYVSRSQYSDLAGNAHPTDWLVGGVYPNSGRGYSFDGRVKPEISAPGAAIISSLNSYAAPFMVPASIKVAQEVRDNRTYYWGVSSGTSMATPVVTGIMALWLQAFPQLSLDEARKALQFTAQADANTGTLPNGDFGYGKVDALAGLRYLIETITSVENVGNVGLTYDSHSNVIRLVRPASVSVYALSGHKVLEGFTDTLSLACLPKGLYLVQAGGSTLKVCVSR